MISTIFIGILLLIAVALFVLGRRTKRSATLRAKEANRTPKAFSEDGYGYLPPSLALVPLVIALFVGFMSCTTIVQAKQEGVLLTFGKPSDRTLDPGLNVHLPWQKVVTVDTTRKTDNFNNGRPNDEEDPTQDHEDIECTLGDNGIATIKASVSWQPADEVANTIYSEYRSEDPAERLREDLVVPRFRDAVNQVCGTYRPTAQIDLLDIDFTDPEETTKALQSLNLAPDFPQLSRDVETVLEQKLNQGTLGPLVDIINVSVSRLALPSSSQNKIQDFLDEVSKTRIALQSQATNRAQAEANRLLLGEEGGLTDLVLVSRCLDLIDAGKLVLTPGNSCWPGGGSGVIIPAAPSN